MGPFSGRSVLVTGGGTGVGAAIATSFHAAGAHVTVAGRRAAPLAAMSAAHHGMVHTVCDVTDEADVTRMMDAAAPDIVVANAGAAESSAVTRTSLEAWNAMLSVNLTGAFLTARAAVPAMKAAGWGRIVFVASTAGLKGYPYVAAYCAAKHGVVGLARSMAVELATTGITVNAVCPGFTETPLLEESIANIVRTTGRSREEARAALLKDTPLGRFTRPEEVAHMVLALCAGDAGAVTGQAVAIAGGEI